MKKLLLLCFVCVGMLLGGVFLSACGQSSFFIKCSCAQPELVYTVIKRVENGTQTEIVPTDNKYEVKKNTNVRVEFYATGFGVDLSGLDVKVNGQSKQIQVLTTFNSLDMDGDLYYGYFLLPLVDKDQNIIVDGAAKYKNSFKFEASGMDDETTVERLKSASISTTQNEEDFVNFYDFLQQNKSIDFELYGQGQNFERMFWFKFDSGNPYNVTPSSPFMLKAAAEGEDNQPLKNVYFSSGTGLYTVELQDVGGTKENTILVDFSNLQCQQYQFDIPAENLTYKVELQNETSSIETQNVVTIKKLLDAESANYDNMKVYLNQTELLPQAEQGNANEVTYLIDKGLTPYKTGSETENYVISVTGIEYIKPTNVVSAQSIEDEGRLLIEPEIFEVDENGEKLGVLNINGNGEQLTFSGRKNALAWGYKMLDDGYYISRYDIYDYDIYLNENFVFNVKDVLKEASAQDFEKVFDDGTVFKAQYNEVSQKFDKFQILFTASVDCHWEFKNFVMNRKQVGISFSFALSEKVPAVCYAVVDSVSDDVSQANWVELESGVQEVITVTTGKLVLFRVQITEVMADYTYMVRDSVASNTYEDTLTYTEGENMYLLYRRYISDYFLDETYPMPSLELILSVDL